MKVLVAYWERVALAAMVALIVLVAVLKLTSGSGIPTLQRADEAQALGSNIFLTDCASIVARAKAPVPAALARNLMTHDFLQYCPQCRRLQPKYAEKCPECQSVVNYPSDYDLDGIPNSWEREHGLIWTDARDAAADPDKDGLDNLAEYKKGSDPQDPTSPNAVAEEYAVNNVYYPSRPILFRSWQKLAAGNMYFTSYKGKSAPSVKDGGEIKDGTSAVYRIEAFVERKSNWVEKGISRSMDMSELKIKDLRANESFVAVINQTNYLAYLEAKITRKKDNAVTNLVVGGQLAVETVNKTAKLTVIDEKNRKCEFTVGSITYPVNSEK